METLPDFEQYAKMWIALVEKFGGTHHGYFMPSEGASDTACPVHFSEPRGLRRISPKGSGRCRKSGGDGILPADEMFSPLRPEFFATRF